AEGATIIELDRDVVLKELVPMLVERHFSAHEETDYRVAIVAGAQVLYSSQGQWTAEDITTPDASVSLLGAPGPGGRRGGGRNRGPGQFPRLGFQNVLIGQPWDLLAKHRSGSLERAVEQLRKRNLAISFGILLVLGAGLITFVISSQRARTLGKLQMEFAAGVSHELRTPLAVIRSAAYNLSKGIVHDKEGVEQYASIVQDEARRLSDMVDQVLLYSETQSGRKKYSLAPVDVNEVIDRAISNLSPALPLEECELTTHIHPELPPVLGDASALTQCVQNLLSNAFKYGKKEDKFQIEIAAEKDPASNEVQVSITDHGPGIDPVDNRHLFEPFYRGARVGSNVPGNGLGLHLVKRIMQAQNGRVTYTPVPEGGARFTLHIPVAP
ncbi:MAG TPA: HAMP domain-containing sensor histidine kinase, partial [Terriglobia bacterium]|nr:HAMP domain-containing sensor histidine kinase [Terriglobia bacterium]